LSTKEERRRIAREARNSIDNNTASIAELKLAKLNAISRFQYANSTEDKKEMKAEVRQAAATMRRRLRTMKYEAFHARAKALQEAHETNDPIFYKLAKSAQGPGAKKKATNVEDVCIYQKDGQTLTTTKEETKARWTEHFRNLLNQPGEASTIQQLDNNKLLPPQQTEQITLQRNFTIKDLDAALPKCKNNKAKGEDDADIAMFKALVDNNKEALLVTLNMIWGEQGVPHQWRDVIIKVLHKKGTTKDPNNFRGISLISHVGKLMERLIQMRLEELIKIHPQMIPDAQSGFMRGRSTMDAILTSIRLAEIAMEQGITLHQCFVDLTKAYDTVQRPILWEILKRWGVPSILLRNIRQFHEGATAKIRFDDGEFSDTFELRVGLKQGAVFSPLLFNIFFTTITNAANSKYRDQNLNINLDVAKDTDTTYSSSKMQRTEKTERINIADLDSLTTWS
jgi:hypothetical protein